jgi:MYND finger
VRSRIPRWENDGISKFCAENLSAERVEASTRPGILPLQRYVTELLGTWPSAFDLHEQDAMGADFCLSMPFMIQSKEARDQQDLLAAQTFLLEAYRHKDDRVKDLINKIGCKSAVHKASRDPSRFPPMDNVIAQLLNKNLATDANLELLFGDVARVRGKLFELGSMLANPPPETSAILSNLMATQEVKASPKVCAECGATESSGKAINRCQACKSIHYCGQNCQKKHWPLHRPECLRIRGKPVSAAALANADRARQERDEATRAAKEMEKAIYAEYTNMALELFVEETSDQVEQFLFDCGGKRLRAYLGPYGLDIVNQIALQEPTLLLQHEERLSLGMFPDGIDGERYNFRGILYSDPSNNGAKIIFLYSYLYESATDPCNCIGYFVDGIFVVDKVRNKRAKWKLIPKPARESPQNRREYLVAYLAKAKRMAKAVDANVDLGIHNPGDSDISFLLTEYGNMIQLND